MSSALDALADQLGGVELDLVDGLVVDAAPELLELLLLEVGSLSGIFFGLRSSSVGSGHVAEERVDRAARRSR